MVVNRWPIIRHIRWLYYRRQVDRWYAAWASFGRHDGNREHDEAILLAIWRGER